MVERRACCRAVPPCSNHPGPACAARTPPRCWLLNQRPNRAALDAAHRWACLAKLLPAPALPSLACRCGQAGSKLGSSSSMSKLSWSCACRNTSLAVEAPVQRCTCSKGSSHAKPLRPNKQGHRSTGVCRGQHAAQRQLLPRGRLALLCTACGQRPAASRCTPHLERVQRAEQIASQHKHDVFRDLRHRKNGGGWVVGGSAGCRLLHCGK